MTESKQAALAGTAVFLVLMGLMLLAAMAMASPISQALPEAQVGVTPHDAQVTCFIEHLKRTLEQLESGPRWEGAALKSTIRTSSLDMPWVWEEYPEWRLASSYSAAMSQRPVGDIPVCKHLAGGPVSIAVDGVSTTP